MVVDQILFNNSDWTTIPRLSFSGDLSRADRFDDEYDHREDSSLLWSPSSDFCFSVPHQYCSSSADQLFCNGKILPLAPLSGSAPQHFSPPPSRPKSLQEAPGRSKKPTPAPETSKFFWSTFSRSSLNCRSITKPTFVCSLNRLAKSRSVGASTTVVASNKAAASVPPKSARPGKRRTWNKEYHNGVKISPILNVPTSYISKGKSSLFNFFFLCRN